MMVHFMHVRRNDKPTALSTFLGSLNWRDVIGWLPTTKIDIEKKQYQ
jgi:hypothetical protein